MEAISALKLVDDCAAYEAELSRYLAYAIQLKQKLSDNSDLATAIATAQGISDDGVDNATFDNVADLKTAISTAISSYTPNPAGDIISLFIFRPGFEGMTAESANYSSTKGKDYSSEGWTMVDTGDWGYGAIMAYGSGKTFNNAAVPATDDAGNSGNTLGISVGWGSTQRYQSEVITLKKGSYRLSVKGYNANTTATQFNSKLGFVPTSGEPSLSTKTSFASNTWETDEIDFELDENTEGRIQIGGTAVSGGSGDNAKIFFDNITLTYFDRLKLAQIQWQETRNALDALDETALPDAAEEAITDALDAAEPTTVEGYNTAKEALQALIDSYDAIKAAYDKALALIDLATDEKDNSTGIKTTIEAAISTAEMNIETRTTADDLISDYNTLETARQTYVTSGAHPIADHVFDLTFKISDATVTGSGNWSNKGTANGQQYTGAPDNKYMDCGWNSTFQSYQTVSDLPAGYYTLKAATRANSSYITAANIYVNQDRSELNRSTDNHKDGNTGGELGNGWSWTEVNFELRATGSVSVGFYAKTTSTGWAGADDFHLYYKGNAVDDETANALKATVVDGKMNATVANTQDAALSTFESEQTIENYEALEVAIAAASASKTAYASANEKLIAMKAVVDATNVYTEDALYTYYTSPKSKYDDNSLTDEEANNLQNPSTTTGHKAAITVDDFLLSAWNTAPNFDGENSPYYINTWSTEGNTDGTGMTTPFFEYYVDNTTDGKLAERTLTATMEGVAPGNYYVDVLVRISKNGGEETTVQGITLDINDGEATDLCTGEKDVNARFYGTFRAFGTVEDDGILKININVAEDNNVHWLAFKNVKFDVFTGATTEQKAALATAISNAEGKTLGFEDEQYAPYNNIDAIQKLNAAKAVDPETATAEEVTTATTALTGATWTANEGEVDAIFNGTFAETGTGNNPKGWTRSNNGWGQQITGLTAEANGVAEGTTTAWYYNNNGSWQYGNNGVYTMPLAKHQSYVLSFKYRKHGNDWQSWMKASVLNADEEGLEVVQYPGADNGTTFQSAKAYFTTGEAGNYILSIEQNGNAHLTDVSLLKVESATLALNEGLTYEPEARTYYETVKLTRTIKGDDTWNTFVVPFDITNEELVAKFGEDVAVAEFSDAGDDADHVTVSFAKMGTPAITANKPVLLKGNAGTSFTFNGKLIKTGDAKVAGTYFDFVGSYDDSFLIPEGDYYISQNKLWKSKGSGSYIMGTRAYLKAKEAEARVVNFFIDDETTSIGETLSVKNEASDNAPVYNLNGQKMDKQSLRKGLYIQNGKKVVRK